MCHKETLHCTVFGPGSPHYLGHNFTFLLPLRDQGRLEVSEEVMSEALSRMRADLTRGDVSKKRDLLRRFADHIEAEKKRARLWYTFPPATGLLFYAPSGIRIRVTTLKGWCPSPLDDGGVHIFILAERTFQVKVR